MNDDAPNYGERTVFMRTRGGDAAVASPPADLERASLRLLALIDGRRCIAELPRFARAGELDRLIGALLEREYVRLQGQADAPDQDAQRMRAARASALLTGVKRELDGVFLRELGAAGEVWEARVKDCVSIEVLRQVLREAIDVLYFRCGDQAARRVVALVKPLFRQSDN